MPELMTGDAALVSSTALLLVALFADAVVRVWHRPVRVRVVRTVVVSTAALTLLFVALAFARLSSAV